MGFNLVFKGLILAVVGGQLISLLLYPREGTNQLPVDKSLCLLQGRSGYCGKGKNVLPLPGI
jgi:hypothetical protein